MTSYYTRYDEGSTSHKAYLHGNVRYLHGKDHYKTYLHGNDRYLHGNGSYLAYLHGNDRYFNLFTWEKANKSLLRVAGKAPYNSG